LIARARSTRGARHLCLPPPAGLELLAVDGTFWSALPRMFPQHWGAGAKSGRPPGLTGLTVFSINYGLPKDIGLELGYADERALLRERLQACALYLLDAGFIDYLLLQEIIDRGSAFVVRARDALVLESIETRPLTAAAQKAGVLSDTVVRVGSAPHRDKLKQPLRRIEAEVALPPPTNLVRQRKGDLARGGATTMRLVVLTNLLDVPPEVILECYRLRWQIEIFFRWLKQHVKCLHLIFESENGLRLQVLTALIASVLVSLLTGALPRRAVLKALQMYFAGWYDAEDVLRTAQEEAEKNNKQR
jgi:hypothetical protein